MTAAELQERASGRDIAGPAGWLGLGLVLASSLALGANRPASWVFVSAGLLVLLAAQLLVSRGAARRPLLPAALFLGALAWGWLQTVPGLLPAAWMHPLWSGLGEAGIAPLGGPTVSADPSQGQHRVLRLAAYGAVFWLVAAAAMEARRARAMLGAVAVFSTALAAYGLYTRASGVNPILGEDLTREGILQASFVNRNSYATYAAFGVIANLAMVAGRVPGPLPEEARRRLRTLIEAFVSGGWVFVLGAFVCLGALVLTQSRGGAMSLAAGLAVFVAAYRSGAGLPGKLLAGLVLALVAVVGITMSSGLAGRLLATTQESLRFAVYPEILVQVLERPLLGHGLGAFHEVFRARVPYEAAIAEWDLGHSAWLETLHALGVPAALALFAAVALIGWRVLRGAQLRRRNRELPAAALAVAAVAAVHSLVDFSLQMPACAMLFAALLAIGWAQSEPTRMRRPEMDGAAP